MADTLTDTMIERGLYELLRLRLTRVVLVPSPAAGADWTFKVPAGVTWELLRVHTHLVTSAVVANRTTALILNDQDGQLRGRYSPNASQVASGISEYDWVAGLGYTTGVFSQQMGMGAPPDVLQSGWSVATLTGNLDVGDQWSLTALFVREWSPQQVATQAAWIARQQIATELPT